MQKSRWVFFLIWFTGSVMLASKALYYMIDLSWLSVFSIIIVAMIVGGIKGYFVLRKAAKRLMNKWENNQRKSAIIRLLLLVCIMQLLVVLLKLMQLSSLSMAMIDLSISLALFIGSLAFIERKKRAVV